MIYTLIESKQPFRIKCWENAGKFKGLPGIVYQKIHLKTKEKDGSKFFGENLE